ncbi:hypothetical protein CIL05_01475 [Virgibacillus profundi]|uniref:TATA-box binding protein n=1 Tax=Virgibacillus profundi TaxID=2024555 RepID=A0A2A2IJL9_9BACI|nr:YwmB family TATA-box binding protein [Virgibacillus profundi]PAV31350.1 hypothetical protein CIL05_01475 [Virgibacillus profundi]PXY55536.1 hypothetical protein CIT14_01485 [Virgibacillus profundi]
MKKIVLITFLLLSITTDTIAEKTQVNEMTDIANYVLDNKMKVEGWQLTIKEQIDRQNVNSLIKEMKNSYLVTRNEDENSIKYSFSSTHKTESVVEFYNVIIPKEKIYDVELIGVLKGENWDDSIEENYNTRLKLMMNKFFTKSAKSFACLTTSDDGIMKADVFIYEFAENFNVQQLKTQIDTVKKSLHKKIIYGYIPLWNEKITIMDRPMNVQIAVTENEIGNQTYIIGTPILINEY